jgi:hypothetical protein
MARLRLLPRSALAVLAVPAGLLAACGGSGGSGAASTPAAKSACQQVGAALADGPDSGADPVGYAFAQILPLRAIRISSDPTLHAAIDGLASAYQTYYSHNGSGDAVRRAVDQAAKKINALCPGAGAGV